MGVVHVLAQEGMRAGGLELTISGDVPQGAGLSSSAALEVACALAVVELHGWSVEGPALARMAQRAECEAGLRVLQGVRPGTALRDYSQTDLEAMAGRLDSTLFDRCRHVIEENERVLAAERALSAGDLVGFGRLMNASHESLRDLFQVACPELDWLVQRARETPGVLGSRMTGAGFGGCTVSLICESATEAYASAIAAYPIEFGQAADVLAFRPAPGARVVIPSDP